MRHHDAWQTRWDVADDGCACEKRDRQLGSGNGEDGADEESGERGWEVPAETLRPEHTDREGYAGDDERADAEVNEPFGPGLYSANWSAGNAGLADEWEDLQDDNDHADTRHKPGNNGVRGVCDESSDLQDAEQDLNNSGEDDDCERVGQIFGSCEGNNRRHGYCHGSGGARDL